MKITITNNIDITEAPESQLRKTRDTFSTENRRWADNNRMSRWNIDGGK